MSEFNMSLECVIAHLQVMCVSEKSLAKSKALEIAIEILQDVGAKEQLQKGLSDLVDLKSIEIKVEEPSFDYCKGFYDGVMKVGDKQ